MGCPCEARHLGQSTQTEWRVQGINRAQTPESLEQSYQFRGAYSPVPCVSEPVDAAVGCPLQSEKHNAWFPAAGDETDSGPGRFSRSRATRVVADIVALNLEAVEAGMPASSSALLVLLLLPPIIDMGLDAGPDNLHVLTQLHRSLLA